MPRRLNISSPKSRAKKPARQWSLSPLQKQLVVGFSLLLVVCGLMTGVWYVTRIDALQIATVQVQGGYTISPEFVEERINTTLAGNYLHLIPRRFSYTYPEASVAAAVTAIPRVKSVAVDKVSRTELRVDFTEYVPYALWCHEASSTPCVFLDEAGYAFDKAPTLTGGAFIRFLRDDDEPQVGQQPFAPQYLKATLAFAEQLEAELGMVTTLIHLRGDYDIDFSIAGGGVIKVSQHLPFATTFANLVTILRTEEFSDIEPGSFQYIDLRFGDKVFINEEFPVTAEADMVTTSTGTRATVAEDVAVTTAALEAPAVEQVSTATEEGAVIATEAVLETEAEE